MITVEQAQDLCLGLVQPTGTETIDLATGAGRVLAAPVTAKRDQPPFSASAMDGYAMAQADATPGNRVTLIGESAAGHAWDGTVQPGQCVRIFTGAPVPAGADCVVIQENVTAEGGTITLGPDLGTGDNIRRQGADFAIGQTLDAPRVLRAADMALIAAMNQPQITVARRPKVALISTGDELLMPGGNPRPDQIIASNVFALHAMLLAAGADPHILPIAEDSPQALDEVLGQAETLGADIVVTIGGASVGDHDLVAPALDRFGVIRSFHKIAMRPGKPLMAGQRGDTTFLGLPGNPVSAIVCGHLFLMPIVRRALGLTDVLPRAVTATLQAPLPKGGPRAHYMRAVYAEDARQRTVTAFDKQDSSMLTVLADANCLLLQPIDAPAMAKGQRVTILPI